MDTSNKPYYIIGSSVCGGVFLAFILRNLKEFYKNSKFKTIEKKTVPERRFNRANSVIPAFNRIKLSLNAKFTEGNTLVEELNFLDAPTNEIFKVNHSMGHGTFRIPRDCESTFVY